MTLGTNTRKLGGVNRVHDEIIFNHGSTNQAITGKINQALHKFCQEKQIRQSLHV